MTFHPMKSRPAILAGSIAALALVLPAAATAPAVAAGTDLAYTCTFSLVPNLMLPDSYNDSLSSSTVEYGGSVALVSAFTFDGTNLSKAGYVRADGSIVNDVTLKAGSATSTASVDQKIASFSTAAAQSLTVSGKLALGTTAAGSVVTVTAGDGKDGDLVRTFTFYKDNAANDQAPLQNVCTLNAGQNTAIGQVTVTRATTATKVTVKKVTKHKLTASAVIAAPNSTQVASGKAKIVVSRSGKTVKSKTVTLKKGAATHTFSGLKAVKYKVTVTYLGTSNFVASTASASRKL